MAIELKKKQPIDLTKRAPGLRNIVAGLGWDSAEINGKPVDCDVSVFMLGNNGKIPADGYFVFYNNLTSEDGAVAHAGDSRTGDGDGDDESIGIDLAKISSDVMQLLFVVTIHEAQERAHQFANVSNAFIRVVNRSNGEELCRYNLTDEHAGSDSVLIGRLYRSGNEWAFEGMGDAFSGGLETLLGLYS